MSINIVKLPNLSAGQVWTCAEGCGECTPLEQEFVVESLRDKWGHLISELITNTFVSDCCHAALVAYDINKNKVVPHSFVETQKGPTRKVYSTGIIGKSFIHP